MYKYNFSDNIEAIIVDGHTEVIDVRDFRIVQNDCNSFYYKIGIDAAGVPVFRNVLAYIYPGEFENKKLQDCPSQTILHA